MKYLALFFLSMQFLAFTEAYEPFYKLDLGLPPIQRWVSLAQQMGKMGEILPMFIDHVFTKDFLENVLPKLADAPEYYFGYELAQEMRGYAQGLNISVAPVIAMNLLYDLGWNSPVTPTLPLARQLKKAMACTSVLAKRQDGTIVHGRNLDLVADFDYASWVVQIQFMQAGAILFEVTTIPGLVGVFTGLATNRFSISQNTRDFDAKLITWDAVLERLAETQGAAASGIVQRRALQYAPDFDRALTYITSTPQLMTQYLTMASPKNGGAVVARELDGSADVWKLTDSEWFLVQPNKDHWKPLDERSKFGNQFWRSHGQSSVSTDTMWQLMSSAPILRVDNSTVHTTVMDPSTNYYQTIVRRYK